LHATALIVVDVQMNTIASPFQRIQAAQLILQPQLMTIHAACANGNHRAIRCPIANLGIAQM